MTSRALALRYSSATFAASLIWTVVLVLLARQGRTGQIGWLLGGELLGGAAAPLLARWLPPSRRLLVAAVGYTLVRAALVPSLAAGVLAPTLLCLAAGACWRLLSGVVIAAAAQSARALATTQAWSSAAATAGTAAAALLVAVPWPVLAVVAAAILLVAPVPAPAVATPTAVAARRRWHLPAPAVTVTAVVVAATTTALPRLLPAVTEVAAGTVWVAPAAAVAFAVTFTTPRLVQMLPVAGLGRATLLAAGAAAAWLVAGWHPVGLLSAVAVGNGLRQVADVHVDTLAAVGPDPSRTLVNVQVLQALAGALAAAAASALLGQWPLWQLAGTLTLPVACLAAVACWSRARDDRGRADTRT